MDPYRALIPVGLTSWPRYIYSPRRVTTAFFDRSLSMPIVIRVPDSFRTLNEKREGIGFSFQGPGLAYFLVSGTELASGPQNPTGGVHCNYDTPGSLVRGNENISGSSSLGPNFLTTTVTPHDGHCAHRLMTMSTEIKPSNGTEDHVVLDTEDIEEGEEEVGGEAPEAGKYIHL